MWNCSKYRVYNGQFSTCFYDRYEQTVFWNGFAIQFRIKYFEILQMLFFYNHLKIALEKINPILHYLGIASLNFKVRFKRKLYSKFV